MNNVNKLHEYIKSSWLKSRKKKDCDKGFPLPYDYIPPCIDGDLINLYYWDTYFTNKGLYLDGLANYAFNNIENLKYCLRKFGCVPNMCRANGADYASQPPLLSLMVKDYFDFSKDFDFLRDSYECLLIEYAFWMSKRISENGLNHYGTNKDYESLSLEELRLSQSEYEQRTKTKSNLITKEQIVLDKKNKTAEGESGEDHTPRFQNKAYETNAIDLNCILYNFELNMADFAKLLSLDDGEIKLWQKRAVKRKTLINEFCLDKSSGIYFDYNYITKKQSKVICSACYLPYVFGITNEQNSLRKINDKLIMPFGVSSCEKLKVEGVFQWGYPNAWAPHQYYAYIANENTGLTSEARLIAQKWLNTLSQEYNYSGKLYEKYDSVVGGKATVNEYGTPEMLGWTAGIFEFFYFKTSVII